MTDAAVRRRFPFRLIGWGGLALLLSLPAILRFPWTLSDFVIMGVLLGTVGLGIEGISRLRGNLFVKAGATLAVLTGFLTIWVNLAVGMIGEDEPYNLLFLTPLLTMLVGSIIVRMRANGLFLVALAAAALQVAIGLGGYGLDPRGAVLSAGFGLFWLFAAALFRAGSSR